MFNKDTQCKFCHRSSKQVGGMMQSTHHKETFICKYCIKNAFTIFSDKKAYLHEEKEVDKEEISLPKPMEIKEELDQYVIGQEKAKKTLAVAVYNHYKRLNAMQTNIIDENVLLEKSNVLLIGPTGTGKTLLIQSIAKKINVPLVITDATTLTQAGYVGDDVESILQRLLQKADYDTQKAERGIIYIDEIDKIAKKSANVSITRDVSGEGVQQSLLKIIEGTIAGIPPQGGRKHPEQKLIYINTRDILFICGGAFVGLDQMIKERVLTNPLGFGADFQNTRSDLEWLFTQMLSEDLISFGLIPELIGRLPSRTVLHELDEEMLIEILIKPQNSVLSQYAYLLYLDNIKLWIEKAALTLIAQETLKNKTGARGLRQIIENLMLDSMFSLPQTNEEERQLFITCESIHAPQKMILLEKNAVVPKGEFLCLKKK